MEVLGWKKSFNTFGHSHFYTLIGHLLTARLGDYGAAVEELEITGCLQSADDDPHPTLRELFEQFQEHVANLPQVIYCRKCKRVEIHFLSERLTAEDDEGKNACLERRYLAAQDVAAALPLLRNRIHPEDDFDVERFLADATTALANKIETIEEWEKVRQASIAKRQALRSVKDPWESLGVDREQFHPNARDVLDDPFFWESANELAPHGNDTGAALFEEYRQWDKRHPSKSPLRFLDGLLHWWDIEPIDWLVTDVDAVGKLHQDQPVALNICNEAAIGLAFAVIKMRASCPSDLAERGLAALTRTSMLLNDRRMSSKRKAEWSRAIRKMWKRLNERAIPHEELAVSASRDAVLVRRQFAPRVVEG